MTYSQPARMATGRARIRLTRVAGLLAAIAAVAAVAGHQVPASSSPKAELRDAPPRERHDPLGKVAKLDPALLGAMRQAAADAADAGVALVVTSGWRSPAHQEELLRAAIAKYGSREEAARWVATPNTSAHVSGDAVDVGPPAAAAWLAGHGAAYGLCRIYGNEPWHYELRPAAVVGGCPPVYADPTQDPRMHR